MGHFATAVEDGDFNFVPSVEKIGDFAYLYAKIVFTNLETKAHLLYVQVLGITLVLLELLGALVVELAPINQFGNRGIGFG